MSREDRAWATLRGVLERLELPVGRARVLDLGVEDAAARLADAGATVVGADAPEADQGRFDLVVAPSVSGPGVAKLRPGGAFVHWGAAEADRASVGGALVGAGLEQVTVRPGLAIGVRPVGEGDETDLSAFMESAMGGFERALGLRFTRVTAEVVEVEVPVGPHLVQPFGVVHGGVYAAIAETVCSVAGAVNVMPTGRTVVGLDNHTSFLRAVREGLIRGRATAVHLGRRSHVWRAEMRDEQGTLVAWARVRLMVLESGAQLAGETVGLKQ